MAEQPDLIALWRAIVQAGGIPAWVEAQLSARGLLVTRRDAKTLSDRDREAYKREVKAEAQERQRGPVVLHEQAQMRGDAMDHSQAAEQWRDESIGRRLESGPCASQSSAEKTCASPMCVR